MLYPHVSVDCVLLGVNEEKLCVLLVERADSPGDQIDYKLPGSLIYENEDLDDAAYRVLKESTGISKVQLKQFRCFGSPSRTQNKEDVLWLENASKLKIGRIVTVAYLALCKISKRKNLSPKYKSAQWVPVNELPKLPFDHNEIVAAATSEIQQWIEIEPSIVFEYLPSRFTLYELRRTYETIFGKAFDIRNFHKKIASLAYVVPTNEMQEGVAHRAARYYRFDRAIYKKRSIVNKK